MNNYKPTNKQIEEALEDFRQKYGTEFSWTYRPVFLVPFPGDGMITIRIRKANQQKLFAYIAFSQTGHSINLQ